MMRHRHRHRSLSFVTIAVVFIACTSRHEVGPGERCRDTMLDVYSCPSNYTCDSSTWTCKYYDPGPSEPLLAPEPTYERAKDAHDEEKEDEGEPVDEDASAEPPFDAGTD